MTIENVTATEVEALGGGEVTTPETTTPETPIATAEVKPEGKEEVKAEIPEEKAVDDYKQEMIKRFGERPDEELHRESWKSYRELEKEFEKRNVLTKEYDEVVAKFGGIEALKQILSTPKEELNKSVAPAKESSEITLPEDIQQLIDEGELDLSSRKDQMFIARELKMREQEQMTKKQQEEAYQAKVQDAKQTFETFLSKEIATKYELADLNALKAKAYSGGFAGLSDQAFKIAVENEAKAAHERVEKLAEQRKEKALSELEKVATKSVVIGKSTPTPVTKLSMKEVFDKKYAEYFGT